MEVGFPAHRRHPDAIAITADPGDHALDQMLHLGMVGPAEAQRVEIGDWARAHGEDIAQDAADPGRRALIGLDVAGMVVALHLEDRGQLPAIGPVADIDHPGVLARTADHPGASVGSFLRWMRELL